MSLARIAAVPTVLIVSACLGACDPFTDPEDSATHPVATRLTTMEAGPAGAVSASVTAAAEAAACPEDLVCLTPDDLSGRVYAGGLMVGGNDAGTPAHYITAVGAAPEVRLRPDLGKDGELTFSLSEATDLTGDYN